MQTVLSDKLQRFAMLRQGEEAIPYTLFHHKNLAAGTLSVKYTFFNVPVGAQDPDTGAAASEEDTNMYQAGLLSAPNRFLVRKIHVPVTTITNETIPVGSVTDGAVESKVDDIAKVTLRGLVLFKLLNKEYLRVAPIAKFPAGYGLYGALSAATTVAATTISNAFVSNGMPSWNEGYPDALPLETQTSFEGSVGFPKSPQPVTTNAIRLGMMLDGVMYRPEQ